ncbi:hypothetical protein B0A50_02595 [Salinomyces thailandicus]|uniref:Uncharacterized protein n=1 Tax=Salinomyces thailandicus TaxID=706561 RepID=A0A4U0U5S1_9PEZI|nr:hypothetical protein B0A50_02595 [Salinomyces thailandica]
MAPLHKLLAYAATLVWGHPLHQTDEVTPLYRFLGRVNPDTQELTWPATGVEFVFDGTTANVPVERVSGTNSIDIFIDKHAPLVIENVTEPSIPLPTGLSDSKHHVVIRKRTETLFGTFALGDLSEIPGIQPLRLPPPARRMEIIGDSISAGYGNLGEFPCRGGPATEDAIVSYGALTAKAIGAAYSDVAYSARGLIRNYVTEPPGEAVVPELWTRYGANDPDNSYPFEPPADIVVINLGSNDFSYLVTVESGFTYQARDQINVTAYTEATVDFARRVQSKYPDAELFITSSPLLHNAYPTSIMSSPQVNDQFPLGGNQHNIQVAALKKAVAQLGSKTHFVDFPPNDPRDFSQFGCDFHPSASYHRKMAGILTYAINQAL